MRIFALTSIMLLAAILVYDSISGGIGDFPEALQFSFREPVDNAVAWLTVNPTFIAFTKGVRSIVYLYLLHPLDAGDIGVCLQRRVCAGGISAGLSDVTGRRAEPLDRATHRFFVGRETTAARAASLRRRAACATLAFAHWLIGKKPGFTRRDLPELE